jgi:hypothetical protein
MQLRGAAPGLVLRLMLLFLSASFSFFASVFAGEEPVQVSPETDRTASTTSFTAASDTAAPVYRSLQACKAIANNRLP